MKRLAVVAALVLLSTTAVAATSWTLVQDEIVQNGQHLCTYSSSDGHIKQRVGYYCPYSIYE